MTLQAMPANERRYMVAGHPELLVEILDVGLACCALEVGAAITAGLLLPVCGGDAAEASREPALPNPSVGVLLISGTVTDALAPGVLRAWEAIAEPKVAVSFGACANTGGPYWDAPTVTKGIDQLIPISVYIPGCPPRPEALIAGLVRLASVVQLDSAPRPGRPSGQS